MESRLNAYKAAPDAIAVMNARLDEYVCPCGPKNCAIELVNIRASRINARAIGESEAGLDPLTAWCESKLGTIRGTGRAGLAEPW